MGIGGSSRTWVCASKEAGGKVEKMENLVATYERRIHASIERVWENVYDWEHLPWLHSETFSGIRLMAEDSTGWHAFVTLGHGDEATELEIKLTADKKAGRYVTATVSGDGAGTDIVTTLVAVAPDQTDVRVEFCVPGVSDEDREFIGQVYVDTYAKLWDEDQAMMTERQEFLDRRAVKSDIESKERLELGSLEALHSALPLVVEFDDRTVRVVETDAGLAVHDTTCPHMGGPLGEAETVANCVRCPWHGYEFDLATGKTSDGKWRLRNSATVAIESGIVVISKS